MNVAVSKPQLVLKKNLLKRILSQSQLQLMVWPGIIFMLIFAYIPMYGIIIAFKDYTIQYTGIEGFIKAPWVGFSNFVDFFADQNFFLVLKNTLGMNFLGLIIGFPAPIIFALLLNEINNGMFKRVTQTISYLPHFVSWVIYGGLVINLLSTEAGFVNGMLKQLGFITEAIPFLGDPKYFWWIAVLSSTAKGIGFSAILYISSIAGIDQQLYEAAVMDGASRFQKMLHITLPGIAGTIVILFIFAISGILSSGFDQIWVLQNSLNVSTSETIDTYVYKVGMGQMRFSYSTAVGLFKAVISIALLFVANTLSKRITDKSFF